MSMNLAFTTRDGHFVDFPFQTPTDLSYAVIDLPTTEAKLELIENQIRKWDCWDEEQINSIMTEVRIMMTDPTLILTVV
jgi:hypothetical protein